MRSRGAFCRPKNWRNTGSSISGLRTRTRVLELMLTTAGVTRSSIGASDGRGCPSTTGGKAARPMTGCPAAIAAAAAITLKTARLNTGHERMAGMGVLVGWKVETAVVMQTAKRAPAVSRTSGFSVDPAV